MDSYWCILPPDGIYCNEHRLTIIVSILKSNAVNIEERQIKWKQKEIMLCDLKSSSKSSHWHEEKD